MSTENKDPRWGAQQSGDAGAIVRPSHDPGAGPPAAATDPPPTWEFVPNPAVTRKLRSLFDPAVSDDDKRDILADPDVQSILTVGIFSELESARLLLERFLPYLPSTLAELQRQTDLVETIEAREQSTRRWGPVWKALSFVAGNLPALVSLGMHLLGLLGRMQTTIFVVASLAANLLLTLLVIYLHLRRKRP